MRTKNAKGRAHCILQLNKTLLYIYCTTVFLCSLLIVCTRCPLLTLGICAVIIVALSSGIFFIDITTDPIDLWAAPTSQARQEKDYFDKHFGPFYRTSQIFIKPKCTTKYVTVIAFLFLQFFFL